MLWACIFMSDIDKKRQQARELLIKAKVYKILASVFALVGLALFIFIYAHQYEGNIAMAVKEPVIVIAIVMPLLPAIVLSIIASKVEKQFMNVYAELEKSRGAPSDKAEKK